MEELKPIFLEQIEDLREKGKRFLNKEISVLDFKHMSGGMGVYAQRGGQSFMVRLRTPSGIITLEELKLMTNWAKEYNLDNLHFTTRQAVQYHGMSIDDICDLMKKALEYGIYTRGAGGNFPRNVALSPLSGVDKEEAFDTTPYASQIGKYFMRQINTYKLPRKLKVSVSNSRKDTAHCSVQDLGFLASKNNGKNVFEVYLGGGLGKNPKISLKLPQVINPEDVLYYVEGMVELFKAHGNYENKAKARVRYMRDTLGDDEFISEYIKFVNLAKEKQHLNVKFEAKEYNKKGIKTTLENFRLIEQKQEGLYSVYIHPFGGQMKISDLDNIITCLNNVQDVEIRLSMSEGAYFRNLNGDEAKLLLDCTDKIGGNTNFEYSVSCIGIPNCQMGIAQSQVALNEMISYVTQNLKRIELLPKVYFSGCLNSCGMHAIGAIGFTGKKKRVDGEVQEAYELHVNGSFAIDEVRLGNAYGDILAKEIPDFILELGKNLENKNLGFMDYLDKHKDEFETLVNKYLK